MSYRRDSHRHHIDSCAAAKTYTLLDCRPVIPLSAVADGIYEGTEETPLAKVTVQVTVQGQRIADIQLIRHENGQGTLAEAMLPTMLQANTSEVDDISGATMSSKVIWAAVRNALNEGTVHPDDDTVAVSSLEIDRTTPN